MHQVFVEVQKLLHNLAGDLQIIADYVTITPPASSYLSKLKTSEGFGMFIRLLLAGVGLFQGGTGLAMILAPARWFMTAPGIAATGPFNPHFVIDVGLAFLATGLSFLACAWRPRLRLAAFGGSGFVVLHAGFHLLHLVMGESAAPAVDIGLAVPAVLGVTLTWPSKEISA